MLKSSSRERAVSEIIHQFHTPVLISPSYLRSLGAGQVDFVLWSHDQLYLIELKSSLLGIKSSSFVQERRLSQSGIVLSTIFSKSISIIYTF